MSRPVSCCQSLIQPAPSPTPQQCSSHCFSAPLRSPSSNCLAPVGSPGRGGGRQRKAAGVVRLFGKGRDPGSQYPFDEGSYLQVYIRIIVPNSFQQSGGGGLLMFDKPIENLDDLADVANDKVLLLGIGGDTYIALVNLLSKQGVAQERPLTVDLLHTFMEHVITKHPDMSLIRMAVVKVENDIYRGRLFFGDRATGKSLWDCDCRPSDGCWIAAKMEVPIYVKKDVWKECARQFSDIFSGEEVETTPPPPEEKQDPWAVANKDPEEIKLLKRQMNVAIAEEDYAAAARIRDHPYMLTYQEILRCREEGLDAQARQLEEELNDKIKANRKDN